ncbi:predicted protein [Botrytis cinerea T4]|uniref:Uncharacterized protein n=1 Tax=Botryotinia fuckeliana (strain T4) TaxID=999810 RepID=G2XS17_BOTF4|nr:predicted protein [Botrytis cinerea T4]
MRYTIIGYDLGRGKVVFNKYPAVISVTNRPTAVPCFRVQH